MSFASRTPVGPIIMFVLDAKKGTIARFEGKKMTHYADAGKPLTFTYDFLLKMRFDPPAEWAVGALPPLVTPLPPKEPA